MKRKKSFFKNRNGFEPVAHRGASREFPENTIKAFKRALEIIPCCMLEIDVRQTMDRIIVIIHDDKLEIKTNGHGSVKDKPISEIKDFDAGYNITFDNGETYPFRDKGYRIATLEEALTAFPETRMSIDIKDNDLKFAEDVMSLLTKSMAEERVIIGSFHNRVMKFIRSNYEKFATSFSKKEVVLFNIFHKLQVADFYKCRDDGLLIPEFTGSGKSEYLGNGVSQGFRIITTRFIEDAHKKEIPVYAWTINRTDNMKRLMDWGIDGIVSDYPDRLKEVMIEKGIL